MHRKQRLMKFYKNSIKLFRYSSLPVPSSKCCLSVSVCYGGARLLGSRETHSDWSFFEIKTVFYWRYHLAGEANIMLEHRPATRGGPRSNWPPKFSKTCLVFRYKSYHHIATPENISWLLPCLSTLLSVRHTRTCDYNVSTDFYRTLQSNSAFASFAFSPFHPSIYHRHELASRSKVLFVFAVFGHRHFVSPSFSGIL